MKPSRFLEFVTIAECGSFDLAADKLFISTSSLSKHIKKLEIELGISLFDRSTRSVKISPAGQILLPYAKKIIDLEEECSKELDQFTQQSKNHLRIATVGNSHSYGIPEVLAEFQKENPNIQLHVTSALPSVIQRDLYKGNYDLAFMRYCDSSQLDWATAIPFAEDRCVAVVSKDHRLANKPILNISDLQGESIIGYQEESFYYDLIASACSSAGFSPSFFGFANRLENRILLAEAEGGIAIISKSATSSPIFENDNIVILDIEPTLKFHVGLFYMKDRMMTPTCKKFLQLLKSKKIPIK